MQPDDDMASVDEEVDGVQDMVTVDVPLVTLPTSSLTG